MTFASQQADSRWGHGGVPAACQIQNVAISNNTFFGNTATATPVATISATTINCVGTPTFAISGADAASFQVAGATLKTNGVDANGSYAINIVPTLGGAIGSGTAFPKTITGTTGTEIGSGITLVNQGTASTNSPVRFGIPIARGDMPAADTLAVQDDAGNLLPIQIDQISTRTGMPGATDTPGWIHAVVSTQYAPSWGNGVSHTFHVYHAPALYTAGAGLANSALTAAHDYQVLFNNVEDGNGNTIGSGNFTCDLNTAIASGARTASGGYDKTYDGAVQTTIEALQPCTDNAGGAAQGQLVAEFWAVLWQATPGSGTLGNVELQVRLSQPWQNVTSPAPKFVWGDASVFDATLSSTLRSFSSTTNFAPADVQPDPSLITTNYLPNTTYACSGGVDSCGIGGTLSIAGTSATSTTGAFYQLPSGSRYLYIAAGTGCTPGGYLIQTVTGINTATLGSSPGAGCTATTWQIGGGTITNTDNIQAGEALTFAATGGGTLPLGITAGQVYFAQALVTSNVPGPVALTLNAVPFITGSGNGFDTVTIASQGSCPAGSCLRTTRHTGIDPHTGAWLQADDQHPHPFWVGANTALLYPVLTTNQQNYCQTTALCPPFGYPGVGGVATPQNPFPLVPASGGPLYRAHSLGPQESNISGGGTHMGLGSWGGLQANWFLSQSTGNWDLLHTLALSQSAYYAHVVLNSATGYIGAYDNGPYPGGGSYPKIGAGMPNAYTIGETNNQYYNQWSISTVPTGIVATTFFPVGPFASGMNFANPPQSHEPDFGEVAAYIFGGEPWYLRALQMQGNFSVLALWPVLNATSDPLNRNFTIAGRAYSGKLFFGSSEQPRGPGHAFRGVEQAATLGADNDPSKAVMWSYFKENVDLAYDFIHNYWGPSDPNLETFGIFDTENLAGSLFMYPYVVESTAEAHAKTHYVSSVVSGASTLFLLNQSVTLVTAMETTLGTTPAPNGVAPCNYWAPVEEGMPFQIYSSALPVPGTPPFISNINQYGLTGDGSLMRASSVDAGGVIHPPADPTASELVQNGDEIWQMNIGGAPDPFGTTRYYAVNVVQGASVNYSLTTTSPTVQACTNPTGSAGCPAPFVPSGGIPATVDLAWRPSACPAAPLAAGNSQADPAGWTAEYVFAFNSAINAGATAPNLATALTNTKLRYGPSAGSHGTNNWQAWYTKAVTIP